MADTSTSRSFLVREGSLFHLSGRLMKQWKSVWVVLTRLGTVDVFKARGDTKPAFDLDLRLFTVVALGEGEAKRDHAFKLTGAKDVLFAADNADELDAWVGAFERVFESVTTTRSGRESPDALVVEESGGVGPGGRVLGDRTGTTEYLAQQVSELTLKVNELKLENSWYKAQNMDDLERRDKKQRRMIDELRAENEALRTQVATGAGREAELQIRQLASENKHLQAEQDKLRKVVVAKLKDLITEKVALQREVMSLRAALANNAETLPSLDSLDEGPALERPIGATMASIESGTEEEQLQTLLSLASTAIDLDSSGSTSH